MWISAATTLATLIAAAGASPGPLPPGEFTATVTAVVGCEAVRVTVGESDALVGLYGVSCLKRSRDAAAAARSFVQAQTAEGQVTVRPVKVLAGMPYAEILLPSGEVLNHLMLSQGLADLDLLTAAGDGYYAGLVSVDAGAEEPAGAAEPATPPPGPPITLEEFRMRRHLRDTAAFEAGLEKWSMMPAEYRASVRRHYEDALAASSVNSAELLAALRSEVDSRRSALDNTAAGISSRQAAIDAERDRLGDDFDLGWNTRLYRNHLSNYYADRATGNYDSARISRQLANRYRIRANLDQARLNAEFEQIRHEHDAEIRALSAEQRAQAEAVRSANTRLRFASINASDRIARILRTLVQFDLYERAIADELPLALPMRILTVIQGVDAEQSAPFTIDAPLGRVDWYADPQRPDASVSGIVYSVDEGRPVARFRSSNPPHESFLFLNGPGTFTIQTEVYGPVSYLIDVFAIDGN